LIAAPPCAKARATHSFSAELLHLMYKFFLVVHAIIAAGLVGVILMQRSEGGGLAGGGSPAGLMSARGAADFLTRTTTILATLFITLSIGLAALAIQQRGPTVLDTSLAKSPAGAPALPTLPASTVPLAGTGPGTPVVAPDVTQAASVAIKTTAPDAKPVVKVEPKKEAAKPVAKVSAPEPAKVTPPPVAVEAPKVAPAAPGNSAQ
jgi:preprotein translocase subunit SecG